MVLKLYKFVCAGKKDKVEFLWQKYNFIEPYGVRKYKSIFV